jgi:hypothetical protein
MLNLPDDADLAARGRIRLVVLLGACSMETALVWTWTLAYQSLGGAQVPAGWLLWAVTLCGAMLAGALRGRAWAAPARAGGLLLVLLVTLRLQQLAVTRAGASVTVLWPALLPVAVLWWRGSVAGGRPWTSGALATTFARGAGLLLPAVLLCLAGGTPAAIAAQAGAVLLFTISGMLALPLAQLSEVRNEHRWRGVAPPAVDRHWLGIIGSGLGAVVLAALLLAEAAAPGWLDPVRAALSLGGAIWFLLASALIWVLSGPLTFLLEHLHPATLHPHPITLQTLLPKQQRPNLRQISHHAALHPPIAVLAAMLVAVVVGAVALLLWRARHVATAAQEPVEEEEEMRSSVWSWQQLRPSLSNPLARLRRRWRAGRRARIDGPPQSTREAYGRLLWLGAERGRPRRPEETPAEYLTRLERPPTPMEIVAAGSLTTAFERVVYGEQPEDLGPVCAAWQVLAAPTSGESGGPQ